MVTTNAGTPNTTRTTAGEVRRYVQPRGPAAQRHETVNTITTTIEKKKTDQNSNAACSSLKNSTRSMRDRTPKCGWVPFGPLTNQHGNTESVGQSKSTSDVSYIVLRVSQPAISLPSRHHVAARTQVLPDERLKVRARRFFRRRIS